mmetsp:Transcript_16748/g.36272  ORF Transcript_16748/g.36272 Transcript_16748/m.36272 type:complete len:190 (-) Transcript_16748:50-619(-)
MNLFDKRPVIAAGCFVAPNATVVGKVLMYNDVSVWYGAVIRGDKNKVKIGHQSNVQDRAVITTVADLGTGFPAHVEIGDQVTIGHGALITSCTIGNRCLIGQGSVVQEGCEIGNNSIVAAGAVVLPGTLIPSQQLWAGNPAVYVRDVTEDEMSGFIKSAEHYSDVSKEHAEEFLPYGTVYQAAEEKKLI